jgi:BMFP domain-containing protein YqiC
MPKTLDQIVQDALGSQAMTILRLSADLEAATARIAELEAKQKDTNGKPPTDAT